MSDTVTQIKVLIEASGKTAPAMTAVLKKIGNGSMQTGITTVAHFFAKEGIKVGTIRGAIGGVAGTVAVGGLIWLVQKVIKDHQLHKEEGEAILKALEDSISGCEEGDTSEPTDDTESEDAGS